MPVTRVVTRSSNCSTTIVFRIHYLESQGAVEEAKRKGAERIPIKAQTDTANVRTQAGRCVPTMFFPARTWRSNAAESIGLVAMKRAEMPSPRATTDWYGSMLFFRVRMILKETRFMAGSPPAPKTAVR